MDYKENILELIGRTPLVKLNKLSKGLRPLILAKMESHNPGGSVKDRIGIAMIDLRMRPAEAQPGLVGESQEVRELVPLREVGSPRFLSATVDDRDESPLSR